MKVTWNTAFGVIPILRSFSRKRQKKHQIVQLWMNMIAIEQIDKNTSNLISEHHHRVFVPFYRETHFPFLCLKCSIIKLNVLIHLHYLWKTTTWSHFTKNFPKQKKYALSLSCSRLDGTWHFSHFIAIIQNLIQKKRRESTVFQISQHVVVVR